MESTALSGFERVSVPMCTWINTSPAAKRLVQVWVKQVSRRLVSVATGRLWRLHGLEHVVDLQPPRAIILVSNHRSFFDMYIGSAALYDHARFLERLYFPVRAPFFYTSPIGLLVNLVMSGCAMWPPVFKGARRDALNPLGLVQMLHVLDGPGSVLGIHPEGTRCKSDDPWEMLPARPGVGRLVLDCHPDTLVLPFFITGLSNDFLWEVRRAFVPAARRGPEIRMSFGAPVRAGDLAALGDAARIADHVNGLVAGLASEDRARHGA